MKYRIDFRQIPWKIVWMEFRQMPRMILRDRFPPDTVGNNLEGIPPDAGDDRDGKISARNCKIKIIYNTRGITSHNVPVN
jgi:hypothetical protein